MKQFNVPSDVITLCREIDFHGGTALITGGWVRDQVMGLDSKDIDIEVFNLDLSFIIYIAKGLGTVNEVGKSFGVLKLKTHNGIDIDISLPRTEQKTGTGHKGFECTLSSNLTFKEAAARRDFTMNAMSYDPINRTLYDPFNGISDINEGILRHVSDAFSEDALRVLRGMQFAARFNMIMAHDTLKKCRDMFDDFNTISVERIREEFVKMLTKGVIISAGLMVLYETHWLEHFPELDVLRLTDQNPEWHPEGNVWNHTLKVMDELQTDDIRVKLAALCHDMGKPACSIVVEGKITSPGHEKHTDPVKMFLKRIGFVGDNSDILNLVKDHMFPVTMASDKGIRRLARRLAPATIKQLIELKIADVKGTGREPDDRYDIFAQRVEELDVMTDEIKPFVMGRHLIQLGVEPGPAMGAILKQIFEMQLDGLIPDLHQGKKVAVKIINGTLED